MMKRNKSCPHGTHPLMCHMCNKENLGESSRSPAGSTTPDEETAMDIAFLDMEIDNLKKSALHTRSSHTNHLLDLRVMIQDGDYDDAEQYIKDLLDE